MVNTNCLCLSSCSLCAESLLLSMLNHIFDMLGVDRIEYSKEVLSVWISILWIRVLQILHDFRIPFKLRVDMLDAQLIVLRHIDRASLGDLEQLLVAAEHGTDEVPVDCGSWRHVELNYLKRVRYFRMDLR